MSAPIFDIPPVNIPIMFLAGEWGCIPHWYAGYAWQSSAPGQELKFYVYPEFMGYPKNNPPFNAPPYRGKYFKLQGNIAAEDYLNKKASLQPSLFEVAP